MTHKNRQTLFTLPEFFRPKSNFGSNVEKNVDKTGQKGLLILYLIHWYTDTHFCLPFSILSCLFSKTKYKSMFVYFSAEREGGALKTRSQRDNNNKTQKLKMSKHFSMYFWRLFFRILQWIPEEFFDVFTNFFELLLPTKMSFVKRFFILTNFFEFYTAYEYFICTNCQAKIRFLYTVYFDEFWNFPYFQKIIVGEVWFEKLV